MDWGGELLTESRRWTANFVSLFTLCNEAAMALRCANVCVCVVKNGVGRRPRRIYLK